MITDKIQNMRPIQMVDLKKQYHNLKEEIDNAIEQVLESSAFINGKPVQDFAAELASYLKVKHVIPCANGTDALQIAMMALGLQPGDEVITPSFTYIATTEVIALLKLKPVFVEVDKRTFCMDPAAFEKAITPKTKAVVPVHLYGHVAPMDEILEIAKKYNIYVIEDTAQAIGANYRSKTQGTKKAGTMGNVGTTSFFPSKNLGCYGDGGAMFTNDDALAEKLKMIANHGQKKRYYHEMVGCNSRLDTVQAAVLRIKLRHLDAYNAARTKVADAYDAAFKGHRALTIPYRAPYNDHGFHQYTLIVDGASRDGLVEHLTENGIPSMIYYPVPAHRQKMFDYLNAAATELPITDWLTDRVISLPIHTEMEADQQEFIISTVLEYLNKPGA